MNKQSLRPAAKGNDDPTVSINNKKIAQKVEMKIRDNGIGLPQKYLKKSSRHFYNDTKWRGHGFGIAF